MTKSRKLTTTKNKKKTLAERIEALENQSFAQQLLIDELEKKLEQVEKRDPWNEFIRQPIPQQPIQQPQRWPYPAQPTTVSDHTCFPSSLDIHGNQGCLVCGKRFTTVTITSTHGPTSTIDIPLLDENSVSVYKADPVDDIDIVWEEPDGTIGRSLK